MGVMKPVQSSEWSHEVLWPSSHCAQNRPSQELCCHWIPTLCPSLGPWECPSCLRFSSWSGDNSITSRGLSARTQQGNAGLPRCVAESESEELCIELSLLYELMAVTLRGLQLKKKKDSSMKYLMVRSERQAGGKTTMCLVCLKFSNNTSLVQWI